MNTFADKLRAMRNKKKWTLDEMAEVLGTTKQVLSRYENGLRVPKVSAVVRYAELLGEPVSALLPGEDQPDPCIMSLRESLRRSPGMRMLFDAAKKADERDLVAAAKMIQALSEGYEE